jgi:hypothetical protein
MQGQNKAHSRTPVAALPFDLAAELLGKTLDPTPLS